MMSSSKTARVPHSPPSSSRTLNSTGRRVPFGQIVEQLARPHSRPRESVITGAHRHRSSHNYAQCDHGVGWGLGPFWFEGPVMLQTASLFINIDQSKAHADAGDRPHQTITISYSFTGLSNGAWLVSNTHSSWLINISSSTKWEQHFDGPVDVCKSSNKSTAHGWGWRGICRSKKTWMRSIKLRGAVFRLQIRLRAIECCPCQSTRSSNLYSNEL